jgi:cytochrome P450
MGPFVKYLDQLATSREEFLLEKLISNLTFDVIGAAVLETDLNAQQMDSSKQGEVPRLFSELMQTYLDDKNNLPWWIVPLTTLKRNRVAKRIEVLVKGIIQQKYNDLKEEAKGNRSRSIVALSFQDTETLTPQLLSETSDQVRNFLFAGHDTTTSLLQWALYELSRTPRALKAVRDELDEIFGPQEVDPLSMCASFATRGEEIFPRLHYINAVIKETLRLHAPAATTRMTPPGSGFTVHAPTGEEYNLDGTIMYLCHSIIQRDPSVYGDTADVWVPERWLGEAAKSIPASAWRPFERGPRNCIGSELANIESRIIISIVARKYDFAKVGLGEVDLDENGLPMLDEHGQHKVKSELYNVGLASLSFSTHHFKTRVFF